nr:uncharacterized protein LOC123775247 [Procambarus clarkii]
MTNSSPPASGGRQGRRRPAGASHESLRLAKCELPTTAPQISGVAEKYVSGDLLRANCTAGRSHPAATLTWHLNGNEVPRKYTFSYAPVQHQDGLETSRLEVRLRLRDEHFARGVIMLRCTATVAALYTRSDHDFLQLEGRKLQPIVLEQRDSQISVNGSPGPVWWSPLALLPVPLLRGRWP